MISVARKKVDGEWTGNSSVKCKTTVVRKKKWKPTYSYYNMPFKITDRRRNRCSWGLHAAACGGTLLALPLGPARKKAENGGLLGGTLSEQPAETNRCMSRESLTS